MRSVMCASVLVFAACVLACGFIKKGAGGPGGATLANATTDFDELKAWCEWSYEDRHKSRGGNAIRSDEIEKEQFAQIRTALVGKQVRWKIQVIGIHQNGTVGLRAYHYREKETVYDSGKRIPYDAVYVAVCLKDPEPFGGADWRANPHFQVDNVPRDLARGLSAGDYVVVTGRVTKVNAETGKGYYIDLRDIQLSAR